MKKWLNSLRHAAFLVVVMLPFLALTGCGGTAATTQPASTTGGAASSTTAAPTTASTAVATTVAEHAPVQIELLGSSGATMQVAVGIADIVTKAVPWIRMSAAGTANTAANVTAMTKKDPKSTLYMVGSSQYIDAKLGKVEFEGQPPLDKQRLIAAIVIGNNGLITIDPTIKTLQDLQGKKIAVDAQDINAEFLQSMGKVLGITFEIKPVGFTQKYDAVADGQVNVSIGNYTGLSDTKMQPVGNLQELIVKKTVYAISIPKDVQEKAIAGMSTPFPHQPTVAVVGTLPTQTAPFELYGSAMICLAAFDGADDEVVYQITKALAANPAGLATYFPGLEKLTAQDFVKGLTFVTSGQEIAPGAARYYKEAGLWPSNW
jgi:TRAP-type uncharacterized transport system substrate-binding protein